ncbi:Pre-mRNA-splicing factor cwf23 [Meyerozyma sp. JA9]|nr:Pre-mRNA-splicing factor cwf23 [Meyerozyma sp. JA9]
MDILSAIASGHVDIYEFLGVPSDATGPEIRSQYRRKALEFHPDKDPSPQAAEKFHTLSHIYEILNNPTLRSEYDRIRTARLAKERISNEASEQIKAFREKLAFAEQQHRKPQSATPQNTEKLREEGLKKRQELEKRVRKNTPGYVSSSQLEGPRVSIWDEKSVGEPCIVSWKRKPELDGLFTTEIVAEIMAIFGPVAAVSMVPRDPKERYDKAQVIFENSVSAMNAVNHDYKKSASKWDGTKVRKLASLLRGCQLATTSSTTLRDGPLKPAIVSFLNQDVRFVSGTHK